ncbi:Doa1p Ecym_3619 [Eremothecium cymbalariae DBVPG|uniref:Uncharacterized protein n=1 Tax=Eremothecium cymbalariae (strain CBS 270.75 / DBVPG 7215 / KCTC 17166 / NRRL Y-17582) TaxID=931890 RepID=G8JQU6_ERECY|nr:Hypothetical protein Ecym_3619 [Eremothecium cymbalariae DBVPG\
MYELSCTLLGHEQDVRSVAVINNEQIISGSRDGTVRVWSKNESVDGKWDSGKIMHRTSKFVNCVCFEQKEHLVFYGDQESLVRGVSPLISMEQEATYVLQGHRSNVCGLDSKDGWVITSSWDSTAKVWYEGELKFILAGHTAAVWHAIILPGNNRFLTASADKTIKLWEGSVNLETFTNIHSDVVRYLIASPNGDKFLSCSNDYTVKQNDMKGRTLQTYEGHESFVYCVKYLPNGGVVSCGEDRSVRIWDASGYLKQVITLPAVSVWSVDVMPNGDIVAGSSDNAIRIFTTDINRRASTADIEELKKAVENSTISSQAMEFDESKLSPYEILNRPGKKEGQVVVVRSPTGVTEAHQFSGGQWSKIGDVIGASGNDQKAEFEGKLYDYVFDVDIKEGASVLKLPLNANDNPYDVADKFIARHDLPLTYKDQIVNFILKNTQTASFDTKTSVGNSTIPYGTRTRKVLPVTLYLSIDNFNPDTLFNGITKLNALENSFEDNDLVAIATGLQAPESNYELLYANADIIHSSWKNPTPAYDIMRIIVHKLPSADIISKYVEHGLDSSKPALSMLTIRILANAFKNPLWGIGLMSSRAMYDSVFELIDAEYPNCSANQQSGIAIAVSTLLYNYTVLSVKEHNLDITSTLASVLNSKYGPSSFFQDHEEAAYRLVVAYGNLSTVEPSVAQFSNTISWLKHVKQKYGHLTKFQDVFNDM